MSDADKPLPTDVVDALRRGNKVEATKLLRQHTNRRHQLEHKPSTRTRRLAGTTEIAPADVKRVRRLLGR